MTQAAVKWWDDNALRLSAAVSYYTLFSLAPLLVVVIAVAGFVFGEDVVQRTLIGEIQLLLGEKSAMAIKTMLESARQPTTGPLAAVISIIATIVLSSGVFTELQDALNTIWVSNRPRGGCGVLCRIAFCHSCSSSVSAFYWSSPW
jgi:membrane protein